MAYVPEDTGGGGILRRLEGLEKALEHANEMLDEQKECLARLESVPADIQGLRTMARWVAGLIVASSISFAFSVLAFL